MRGLSPAKEKQKDTQIQSLDLFSSLGAIAKPATVTENTRITSAIEPGTIGAAVDANLNLQPKQVIARLSKEFPVNGMAPETKAQMTMAAKLSKKAAEDANFYEGTANEIGGNMAEIHTAQTKHKANMFKHDLTVKKADVKYMGAVEHWQQETMSLLHTARERHAGIQLAHSCL